MKTIIKKELGDHFGSSRFMILMSLIFMVAFLGAYLSGQGVRELLTEGQRNLVEGRSFLLLFTAPGAFLSVVSFLALFGPLAGLVLGFDSINRERNQGTLSKVLSQPIYRDEVILGKFLAGLITLTILLTAMLFLMIGLALVSLGLVPSLEEVIRLFIFWFISLFYFGFWLALAILCSIVFRSVATSALAAAAVWIFLSFFVPILGQALAAALTPFEDSSKPRAEELAAYERVSLIVSFASPSGLYGEASGIIMDPTHRGSEMALRLSTMSRLDQFLLNRFQGIISIPQSLILIAPNFLALIAFSILAFLLSYLAFVRQEIRSA
jgi:ABC-2 type transport system permease protein